MALAAARRLSQRDGDFWFRAPRRPVHGRVPSRIRLSGGLPVTRDVLDFDDYLPAPGAILHRAIGLADRRQREAARVECGRELTALGQASRFGEDIAMMRAAFACQ